MSLTWSSDFQIKTENGNPQSNGGPVLVTGPNGNELFIVYLGSGGSNVWFSYTFNPHKNFVDWSGNKPVKNGNATQTADSLPAIAVIQGKLTILVPQKNVCNILHYQPNAVNSWADAGNTLTFGAGWKNPVMVTVGSIVHLFICDEFDNIWWYTSTSAVFPNNGVILVKEAGASPTVTLFNNDLYLLYWNKKAKVSALMKLPQGPNQAWQDLSAVTFAIDGTSINQGAAIVGFGSNLYVIYTYGKDPELWYATFLLTPTSKAEISTGTPIMFNNVRAKTTSSISAIVFQGQLCVAHKGESDKLYLTYVTGGI